MLKSKIISVLSAYKNEQITEKEAESRIEMLMQEPKCCNSNKSVLENDKRLRIVAYIGTKLIQESSELNNIVINYNGEALSVDCVGNLTCKNIQGNASAGASISCDVIEGNACAGSSIKCNSIQGKATAGSSINFCAKI